MQLGIDVSIKQTQKLALTPQMEQSLSLLQMNAMELNQCIEEELLSNPMLKEQEVKAEQRYEESIGWKKKRQYTQADYKSFLESLSEGEDSQTELKEYLKTQLYTKHLSKGEEQRAEYLIECLEETGYFKADLKDLAEILKIPEAQLEEELSFLQQNMEPCGVFARDLKECLLLQLDREHSQNEKLYTLIRDYLEAVAKNKIPEICQKTGWSREKTAELVNQLKKLEPIPGQGYGKQKRDSFLYPDVTVKKDDDTYQIYYHKDGMKNVTLNEEYLPLLEKQNCTDEQEYLKEQYRNAKILMRNIAKREETLIKVTKAIIKRQEDFFENGKARLKPLNLEDIAEDIEMHESTVSRAINGKYLECRWGVFEFKYFFSNKLSEKDAHSCIKQLIQNENKKKPYSDAQLAKQLEAEGITISRRTVAKYREQMGIPTAQIRREYI